MSFMNWHELSAGLMYICFFTNEGVEIGAKIIYKDLIPFIENEYQKYLFP